MTRPAAAAALFGGEGPRWFTIAAHRPFLDDLAFALDAALSPQGPEALADALVLTPTRRAVRALGESFVRIGSGQAVLLPQIRALGDLDEGEPPFEPGDLGLDLAPAISPRRRRFELARLVSAHADALARPIDLPGALALADALARFLDSVQIEEASGLDRLETLVDADLARHWRASVDFLKIAIETWPRRLAELGLVDVAERRIGLLRALAEQWRSRPPERPLIVAGSTGSAPAAADLLRVIAEAPQGCVVLPGLDLGLADAAWAEVGDAHPQSALKRLLDRAGVDRAAVKPWPAPESLAAARRARARQRVVNEALRPAERTADWLDVIAELRKPGAADGDDIIAEGLGGLSTATVRNEEEAAAVIALLLRETLETPGKTAALVTPDAALSRRVSARLSRFGLEVDTSVGLPLARTPAGRLVGLVARATARPMEPATLLAILKHPAVRLGREGPTLSRAASTLERRGLRGARPASWDALAMRLAAEAARRRSSGEADAAPLGSEAPDGRATAYAEAIALADDLRVALDLAAAPFATGPAPAGEAVCALVRAVEALCTSARGRVTAIWAGPDGEAAAELLASTLADAPALGDCTAFAFSRLIETLLGEETVRGGGFTHPRLRILGAIEARLIHADRLILAGLEEGVWPRAAEIDPFLSRPMRERLGLPLPERRIGLSAHDFAQAACAPEVVLVHAERRDGAPAVMSRWLWRLETLARGADAPATPIALPRRDDAVAWAHALDAPLDPTPHALSAAPRPDPRPPVAARPRRFSVTQVERLVRDPYAIYAQKVLGLRPLDRPDAAIEARARGSAIHTAFEQFAEAWETLDPAEAPARFADLYLAALQAQGVGGVGLARERVLAARSGAWVADLERRRRADGRTVLSEREGAIRLAAPDGGEPFALTCRADRLEIAPGGVDILDFKTGAAPTGKEIRTGFAPQLTLTAAILMQGGFADVEAYAPGELVYVRVTGRTPAGEAFVRAGPGESAVMAETALEGLQALLARYALAGQPYRSRIAPQFRSQVSDYDHLARVREWSAADDEEGA